MPGIALTRRQFLGTTVSGLALGATAAPKACGATPSGPTSARLPRWRGFNLLEKFIWQKQGNPPYPESDFALMAEWGFDFARLPMSYLCWAEGDPGHWLEIREPALKHVDEAVEYGRKHGVHVNLNLHRAPGYCVNPPQEPLDLWKDGLALEACAHHFRGLKLDREMLQLLRKS